MRVLIKYENNELKASDIPDTLEALQKIVGGYIEYDSILEKFHSKGISVIFNEEGKLGGFKPSILVNFNKKVFDIIFGNVIFVGTKITDEEITNIDLTDEQIDFIVEELSTIAIINDENDKFIVRSLEI